MLGMNVMKSQQKILFLTTYSVFTPFLHEFAWSEPKIVLNIKTEQF